MYSRYFIWVGNSGFFIDSCHYSVDWFPLPSLYMGILKIVSGFCAFSNHLDWGILSICHNDDGSLTKTEVDGDRVRVSGYSDEAGSQGFIVYSLCVCVNKYAIVNKPLFIVT